MMTTLLVHDPVIASRLIAERKAQGVDRYDEVSEGVYAMSSMAGNEHQSLVTQLSAIISTMVDWQFPLSFSFNALESSLDVSRLDGTLIRSIAIQL